MKCTHRILNGTSGRQALKSSVEFLNVWRTSFNVVGGRAATSHKELSSFSWRDKSSGMIQAGSLDFAKLIDASSPLAPLINNPLEHLIFPFPHYKIYN